MTSNLVAFTLLACMDDVITVFIRSIDGCGAALVSEISVLGL